MSHRLDTDSSVFFYENEFYVLSNFAPFRLFWQDIDFDTSEHAYHWEKFPDAQHVRELILKSRSAHEAFHTAQIFRSLRRQYWDDVKLDIMYEILRTKALQHKYVLKKLFETGNRLLIEDSWRDEFWGWGPNQDGLNHMGNLWMRVRDNLRSGERN